MSSTLITNVHVFDGTPDALLENASGLVEGNRIARAATLGVIEERARADLLRVDGNPLEDLTPFIGPSASA